MSLALQFALIHGSAVTDPELARDIDVFYGIAAGGRDAEARDVARELAAQWAAAIGAWFPGLPIDLHRIDGPRLPTEVSVRIGRQLAAELPEPKLPELPPEGASPEALMEYAHQMQPWRAWRAAHSERLTALTAHERYEIRIPVPPRAPFLASPPERPPVVWLWPRRAPGEHPYAVEIDGRIVEPAAAVQWSIPALLRAAGDDPEQFMRLWHMLASQPWLVALYIDSRSDGRADGDVDLDFEGYVTGLAALRRAARHAPRLDEICQRLGAMGALIRYCIDHDPHPAAVEWVLRYSPGGAARIYQSGDNEFRTHYEPRRSDGLRRFDGAAALALVADGRIP